VPRVILGVVLVTFFGLLGCTKVQPIITPQEYQASCRQDLAGADAACTTKVCDVYQTVVTDYYEDMAGCNAACKDRAESLLASESGSCSAKIATARKNCLEFCNRKFYRCNCDKFKP
jgi:hypothetical protein